MESKKMLEEMEQRLVTLRQQAEKLKADFHVAQGAIFMLEEMREKLKKEEEAPSEAEKDAG